MPAIFSQFLHLRMLSVWIPNLDFHLHEIMPNLLYKLVGISQLSFPNCKRPMKIFNFEHQFVKYGEFHANKINQAIHLVFVPTILWTAQVWLTASPIYYNWSFGKVLPINAAFIGKY